MIYLIFNRGHVLGYATVIYYSDVPEENIVEIEEEELNKILSPVLKKGESWKDKYNYVRLAGSGQVVLDEWETEEL